MTGRTSAALKKAISLLKNNSISEAARKAGVSRSTIYRHLAKHAKGEAKPQGVK